ncbi:MAG: hypothetical protein ACRECT_04950 [Thermoplasmata archaeon]
MSDGPSASPPPIPAEPEPAGAYFDRAPMLTRFLNRIEEEVRERLARVRRFERNFLLEREWMSRIPMRTRILALFWSEVGGFDAFGPAFTSEGRTVELFSSRIRQVCVEFADGLARVRVRPREDAADRITDLWAQVREN